MDTYTFGPQREYRVVVSSDRQSRERAFSLVYGVYLAAGLTGSKQSRMLLSCHDALPKTTAFLVERNNGNSGAVAVASLTLIPDSPLGLPLDESDRSGLAALRAEG